MSANWVDKALNTVLASEAMIFIFILIIGWMYEKSKNYHYPFIMASVSMLLSALIMIYPRRYLIRPHKENNSIVIDIEVPVGENEKSLEEIEATEATSFIDERNTKLIQDGLITDPYDSIVSNILKADDTKDVEVQEEALTENTNIISDDDKDVSSNRRSTGYFQNM